MKASLNAQSDPFLWVDSLPLVLLGKETALKEDTHSAAVMGMAYGTTLFFQEILHPFPYILP